MYTIIVSYIILLLRAPVKFICTRIDKSPQRMYNIAMYPYFLPELFKGHVTMYGLLLAIGLLCALGIFKLLCYIREVDDKSYSFYSLLGIIAIAGGLLGAYVFQAIYNAINNALTGANRSGGLTFMGGLIFGVVIFVGATAIFAKGKVKRDFFECASLAGPCIVFGHVVGRLGCFCAGCCYGKPTDSSLGIYFPELGYKAYPTQLYEAIFLFVLFVAMIVVLLVFDKYKPMLPIYGVGYSIWRFAIEYLRDDDRGAFIPGLTPSQAQSILLLLVAIALIVLIYLNIIPFAKAKDPAPANGAPLSKNDSTENSASETFQDETPADQPETADSAPPSPDTPPQEKNE